MEKKGKFGRVLDRIGQFETLRSLVQTEFVRTMLWPTMLTVTTAVSGWFGGVQLMWIVMASTLAFAGTTHGLLRSAQYLERKNPSGKLRFLRSVVAMDLVPLAGPLEHRKIDLMQLGMRIHNRADFNLSVIIESAESEIDGITPPRTAYPKPSIIIPPGVIANVCDTRMSMREMPCRDVLGKYEIVLKYGLPGKERFELRHAASLTIKIDPIGVITEIHDSPRPAVTSAGDN